MFGLVSRSKSRAGYKSLPLGSGFMTYRIAAREYTSEQSTVTDLRNH